MKSVKGLSTTLFLITGLYSAYAHTAVVINEIDYDQPGSDTAEFIELFNNGISSVSLDNYHIELINGTSQASYRSINLSGFTIAANSYFVICDDGAQVANCNFSFTGNSGWFQNGAPDALGLYNDSTLMDSLSYEGVLSPFTEGSMINVSDNASLTGSIARVIDGVDTDNNLQDFQSSCITPGSSNIAGSGDCSVIAVSTVPVPAAVWLFGTGLLGIAGFARRNNC